MLLRKLKKHVQQENWFIIFIDLFVVVFGIFIGLQVTDWNTKRQDKIAYNDANERLNSENLANLKTVQNTKLELVEWLDKVDQGFDALLSCVDTSENTKIINTSFYLVTATAGVQLRDSAILELTETDRFLRLQSKEVRQRLANFRSESEKWVGELTYAKMMPIRDAFQNNPLLSLGEKENIIAGYQGKSLDLSQRKLVLNVPISQACKDNKLLKSYYTWQLWQGLSLNYLNFLEDNIQQEIAH